MATTTKLLSVLLALLAVQGTPAFFSVGGTAATTQPDQSSTKARALVRSLAEKHNLGTVVFPKDIIRLATKVQTRPKYVIQEVDAIGMLLGARRLLKWRELAAARAGIAMADDAARFNQTVRAIFAPSSEEDQELACTIFLPFSEVLAAFGPNLKAIDPNSAENKPLWQLWYPSPLLMSSTSVEALKGKLKEAGLDEEIATTPGRAYGQGRRAGAQRPAGGLGAGRRNADDA